MRPFLAPGESRTERVGDGIRQEWRDEVSKALKSITWTLDDLAELERTGRILRPPPITTLTPAEELRQVEDEQVAITARKEGAEVRIEELRRKFLGLEDEEP